MGDGWDYSNVRSLVGNTESVAMQIGEVNHYLQRIMEHQEYSTITRDEFMRLVVAVERIADFITTMPDMISVLFSIQESRKQQDS